MIELGLLLIASIASATINSVAGGGSFLVFPILIFVGIPPTTASITNKFSMFTGTVASLIGYWSEVKRNLPIARVFCSIALIGSLGGSILLLFTSNEAFGALVPWLLLSATLLFAFGKRITRWLTRKCNGKSSASITGKLAGWFGQLIIGIYGGFFGAGKGIMLVALYELMGIKNIHEINGIKMAVSVAINTISVITFLIAGVIFWPAAIIMMIGAVIGGYFGAHYAKKLPQQWIRHFIVFYGLAASSYFFFQ